MAGSFCEETGEFPGPEAPPEQIPPYLAHELITHGMEEDQAEQLASHWGIGTGQDLRSCSLEMLRATFGDLAGWILHKSIQAQVNKERSACGTWSYGSKSESWRFSVTLRPDIVTRLTVQESRCSRSNHRHRRSGSWPHRDWDQERLDCSPYAGCLHYCDPNFTLVGVEAVGSSLCSGETVLMRLHHFDTFSPSPHFGNQHQNFSTVRR